MYRLLCSFLWGGSLIFYFRRTKDMIGIGIDTGGTYTDAVVYDTVTQKILSSAKSLTTKDNLEIGIANALDKCDRSKLEKAQLMALSTTLATNAALEDTGSRAMALMIGMKPEKMADLKKVYASYGLHDFSRIVFLDGEPKGFGKNPTPPDWEKFRKEAKELFGNCRSIGITQVFPELDHAELEKKAKEILREELNVSVTCASELFDDPDVLKRGAGTLLNARLIPVIEDFLKAVRRVQEKRGLKMPIAIIRSDGSMMSDEMALEYPVETLLSGPAASAVGGSSLAREDEAVIVDMGGTTTDLALVHQGAPYPADQGIRIGRWNTTVRGIYVHTFLLGGDSAVRYSDGKLFLDGKRVLPLSLLAHRYPEVTGKLKKLADSRRKHTRMMHEFFVQQRKMDDGIYTDSEKKMYAALDHGPLMQAEMAEVMGTDIYHMDTGRLEEEGLIIRSGITPTDIMIMKGDFGGYSTEAAKEALRFFALNTSLGVEEIPDIVYDLVMRRMYHGIADILLDRKYPKETRMTGSESISQLVDHMYEEAKGVQKGEQPAWAGLGLQTDLPLIGVGAPTHIFLDKVAALLGTKAIIRENSPVANALGAIAAEVITRVAVRVKAEYESTELKGYVVFDDAGKHQFEEYEDAKEFALEYARKSVIERAIRQGTSDNPEVEIRVRPITTKVGEATLFLEAVIEATATDLYRKWNSK